MSPSPASSLKIAKFGGTSVATAAQLRKVQAIIDADPTRRVIVPSAPGKADRTHSGTGCAARKYRSHR